MENTHNVKLQVEEEEKEEKERKKNNNIFFSPNFCYTFINCSCFSFLFSDTSTLNFQNGMVDENFDQIWAMMIGAETHEDK